MTSHMIVASFISWHLVL